MIQALNLSVEFNHFPVEFTRQLIRRLGFLLETYALGCPVTIAALQALVNPRYALLDPTLPDEGPYRARWRLRVNLDAEELKAIVWT